MLTVRGAKSGLERKTPLVHTKDGETILLVASRGGDVKHPGLVSQRDRQPGGPLPPATARSAPTAPAS